MFGDDLNAEIPKGQQNFFQSSARLPRSHRFGDLLNGCLLFFLYCHRGFERKVVPSTSDVFQNTTDYARDLEPHVMKK